MKTDGQLFAARIKESLIEEGLLPEKAEIVKDLIIGTAEAKGWPDVSLNVRARLSRFSVEMQSVFVDDDGVAMLHTGIPAAHQPLVKITNFGPPKTRSRKPRTIVKTTILRAA